MGIDLSPIQPGWVPPNGGWYRGRVVAAKESLRLYSLQAHGHGNQELAEAVEARI